MRLPLVHDLSVSLTLPLSLLRFLFGAGGDQSISTAEACQGG